MKSQVPYYLSKNQRIALLNKMRDEKESRLHTTEETSSPSFQSSSVPGPSSFLPPTSVAALTTVAGTGVAGYSGDGGLAVAATLFAASGVDVDPTRGLYYIADTVNNCIRMVIKSTGIISTEAGTGVYGQGGDGGLATAAQLAGPYGVAVDVSQGNFYIADTWNACIRLVTKSTGIINTVAGTCSNGGYSGDNGLATAALVLFPMCVAVGAQSSMVYISDTFNFRVRKITTSTGIIETIWSANSTGFTSFPVGIAVDPLSGNPFFVNTALCSVIMISGFSYNYVYTVVAGTGMCSAYNPNNGDGQLATRASFAGPMGIAFDSSTGNFYVADDSNSTIRMITRSTGIITTVAGTGARGNTSVTLNNPFDVAIDISTGVLLIADTANNQIRSQRLQNVPSQGT